MITSRVLAVSVLLSAFVPVVASVPAVDPIVVSEVSIKAQDNGAGDDIVVVYRNGSAKRIVAYVAFVNAFSGDILVDTVAQQYVSSDPSTRNLAPGQTLTQPVSIVHPLGKTATRIEATVDWVLFEDGSEFGPNKSGWSVRVTSEMQGAYRERLRLRKLMEEQGTGALEQELKKTPAVRH